jgi:hypothetical protein
MDKSTTLLVKTFNDLPRAEILASHRGPNEWYFDLRYIQFEPNPHHALYLAQTLDSIYHLEPLPAGLPTNRSGLEYFPETGREAAPEVVKGIMYAFLHRMGGKAAPFAPWRLTTPDKRLLAAVNAEFRRIGIHSSLEVTETTFLAHCLTDDCFAIQYNNLKKKMGYTGIGYASLLCPDDICFPDVADAVPPLVIGKDDWHICTAYVRHVMEARPIDEIADSMSVIANMTQEVRQLQERLQSVPEAVVRVQADGGDYEAAFDYGLRLRFGLGCTANRQLSRVYLMKALDLPLSSDTFKATVHAALIEWYVDSRKDGVLKNRYLCAAAHHAKSAILYARRVDPQRKYYCNAVLGFAKTLIDLNERANTIEQIRTLYDDVIQVSKKRSKQVDEERKKLAQKRMKTPHRYRCASAGCRIQSDTGKMLQRCKLYSPLHKGWDTDATNARFRQLRPRQKTKLLQQRMPKGRLEEPQALLPPRRRVFRDRRRVPRRPPARRVHPQGRHAPDPGHLRRRVDHVLQHVHAGAEGAEGDGGVAGEAAAGAGQPLEGAAEGVEDRCTGCGIAQWTEHILPVTSVFCPRCGPVSAEGVSSCLVCSYVI